ncbi:Omp28-related outer membrane protein [Lacinutrix sp. C3R15]|uniref:Omp28-related outer membrane protein n=1 Tax=Flavobacteriaceae TaxID=49546 RepID=UPI001C092F49|nr:MULTISPECIES: Omp28-related outer membrane protein [Flavobacteriaceae]MBU2939268.1 Omp28-related outer membrane protein [Lacinutrix sp. C3R15]MDO6622583.1 Omp28-related outer membrane protein [Oceanihabitans sp. 1_MG-2023]
MKTNLFLRAFFLCLLAFTFGCSSSSDDSGSTGADDDGGGNVVTLTSITISANIASVYVGETVTFTVTGNDGSDLTALADIVVDGTTLASNTFSSAVAGTFNAVATYNTFTNSTVITVDTPPIVFNKNVLIEDYTGAWCGYCPRVAYGIERVQASTDQAVVVAIHRGNSSGSSVDPYNFPAGDLEDLVGLTGYPTAMLNRTTSWSYPEPINSGQVVNLTGDDAALGLALSSTINGSDMEIDVNVKFGEDFSSSNLKLVVYVLEDGLIYDQTNYTTYYGGTSVISDFEHNHVLRASLTDLLGDEIPSAETTKESVYTATFNVGIPSNVSDDSNIHVVAFVVDDSNAALNSRGGDFGEDQTFEEN